MLSSRLEREEGIRLKCYSMILIGRGNGKSVGFSKLRREIYIFRAAPSSVLQSANLLWQTLASRAMGPGHVKLKFIRPFSRIIFNEAAARAKGTNEADERAQYSMMKCSTLNRCRDGNQSFLNSLRIQLLQIFSIRR